jgi:uncharacterized LabA/DUF88 family protein
METKRFNYAFIDSQNLYLSIRDQGWKLDYRRFRRYLAEKYNIVKAYMFIGYIPTNEVLYKSLQDAGYIVIHKPTLKSTGRIKGNVDAELVLQAMIEYPHYDKAVIVSNDGDFYCLIKYLKQKNKLCKLIVPDKHRYSSLLREFANTDMAGMNELRPKVEYKKRRQA